MLLLLLDMEQKMEKIIGVCNLIFKLKEKLFFKFFLVVRNSWGSNWGIDGYFKIARNKNSMCGIGTYGYYTIV
jgi:hypothetical protein